MPGLTVAYYVLFGGCQWEACSFLRGDETGREWRNWGRGEVVGGRERETSVGKPKPGYNIREKSLKNKKEW